MLSLILPTYNEAANIRLLLPRLREILDGLPYEVIVVDDDSPDRTWEVAEHAAAGDARFRIIRRVGKRGLSSAVVDGFRAAKGAVFVVADADGQHDLTLIPRLFAAVQDGADVAIGSRYVEGGSVGRWDERRQFISRSATWLATRLCGVNVRDPMSGFFAISREAFLHAAPTLHPRGFKILLDLLLRLRSGARVVELPFTFGVRTAGDSKLSLRVQLAFAVSLLEATLGRVLPALFFLACTAIAVAAILRLWPIRLLYLDAVVRRETQRGMQSVADAHGWLLSDMSVRSVDRSGMLLIHREHRRDAEDPRCYRYIFDTLQLRPCDD